MDANYFCIILNGALKLSVYLHVTNLFQNGHFKASAPLFFVQFIPFSHLLHLNEPFVLSQLISRIHSLQLFTA